MTTTYQAHGNADNGWIVEDNKGRVYVSQGKDEDAAIEDAKEQAEHGRPIAIDAEAADGDVEGAVTDDAHGPKKRGRKAKHD